MYNIHIYIIETVRYCTSINVLISIELRLFYFRGHLRSLEVIRRFTIVIKPTVAQRTCSKGASLLKWFYLDIRYFRCGQKSYSIIFSRSSPKNHFSRSERFIQTACFIVLWAFTENFMKIGWRMCLVVILLEEPPPLVFLFYIIKKNKK